MNKAVQLSLGILVLAIASASIATTQSGLSFSLVNYEQPALKSHLLSSNPIKSLLLRKQYQTIFLKIENHSKDDAIIVSKETIPQLLTPEVATQKLSQSKAIIPWVLGIGWAALLTNVLGFALIPCIVFGATITLAGVIGTDNQHLPQKTAQIIQHELLDGIHNYAIPSCTRQDFVLLLPFDTKSLTLSYLVKKQHYTTTIDLLK